MLVTAGRVERQLFETPQAVSVLDDEAVEQANAATTPDLLRGVEGVLIQKTNPGGGSPFLRGLTGKQVLLRVDGVRVNNSYFRYGPHQYLNTVDPNLIERVEVVRGPASVLYGSDALGGVINLITRRRTDFADPADLDGLVELRAASADDSLAGRVQFSGNRGRLGVLGGVSAKDFGDLRGGVGVGEQVPTAYEEQDADAKLNYRGEGGQEVIAAHQTTRQFDVPKTSEVTLGDKLRFDYEPQLRALSYVELRAPRLAGLEGLRVNLSYQRQKEGEVIVARAAPDVETRELTDVGTWGLEAQGSLRLPGAFPGEHRLTAGLDYYLDRYDTQKSRRTLSTGASTPLAPGTPDGADYASLGLYLQDEIRLGPRAEAIAGVRYSRYRAEGAIGSAALDFSGDQLTASLQGLYRLYPRWNLVASLAQGYRAPNMEDFFGRVDFVSEIPNTDLKPEQSLAGDLGIKYYSPATSADLYVFQSDYEDLIVRASVAPGVRQRRNAREAVIRGVEGGVQHAFSPAWRASVNFAYARGEDREAGQPLQRIPPLFGQAALRFQPVETRWLEAFSLWARRQDRLSPEDLSDPRIGPNGTPGYATLNLRAGWQPTPGQEWLLTLEDFADLRYKTHGSGVFAPGRGVAVSLRLRWD